MKTVKKQISIKLCFIIILIANCNIIVVQAQDVKISSNPEVTKISKENLKSGELGEVCIYIHVFEGETYEYQQIAKLIEIFKKKGEVPYSIAKDFYTTGTEVEYYEEYEYGTNVINAEGYSKFNDIHIFIDEDRSWGCPCISIRTLKNNKWINGVSFINEFEEAVTFFGRNNSKGIYTIQDDGKIVINVEKRRFCSDSRFEPIKETKYDCTFQIQNDGKIVFIEGTKTYTEYWDTEYLSSLKTMSKKDLRIARNCIYAKYGFTFKSEDLQEYFSNYPVKDYQQINENTNIKLTHVEQELVNYILSLESDNNENIEANTYKDIRDGKVYKIIKIGNQTWMVENLAYKSNSGCWAYGDKQSNVSKYGYLYNWETAKTVCPAGWHLPSDAEWTILTDYLGGENIAGVKMKATTDWQYDANGNATNESGFTALPAGSRYNSDGSFSNLGTSADFWSSSPSESENAWLRNLLDGNGEVDRYRYDRSTGFSVRCVKGS